MGAGTPWDRQDEDAGGLGVDMILSANASVARQMQAPGSILVRADMNAATQNLIDDLQQCGIRVMRVGAPAKVKMPLYQAALVIMSLSRLPFLSNIMAPVRLPLCCSSVASGWCVSAPLPRWVLSHKTVKLMRDVHADLPLCCKRSQI